MSLLTDMIQSQTQQFQVIQENEAGERIREGAALARAKRSQPSVCYKLAEGNSRSIDDAFDILFEEVLNEYNNLTTLDS